MRPTHNVFENVISKSRLDSYKHYFKTKNVDEAIGLYMWNCELSTCFNMLLSFFEIALRNNIHYAMSQNFSKGKNDSIHWYDKMPNLSDKQKKKILDDAMEAMNPDFHNDILQSTWRKKLDYLLSERGISRYRSLNHCPDINQQPLTPLQFRKKFRLIMKKNKPVQVGYSNMKGVFIPE